MPKVSTNVTYVHHVACVIHACVQTQTPLRRAESFPKFGVCASCVQTFAGGSRRRLRGWAQASRLPEGARYNARPARAPGAEQRPDSIFDYQFKILNPKRCGRLESGILRETSSQKAFRVPSQEDSKVVRRTRKWANCVELLSRKTFESLSSGLESCLLRETSSQKSFRVPSQEDPKVLRRTRKWVNCVETRKCFFVHRPYPSQDGINFRSAHGHLPTFMWQM